MAPPPLLRQPTWHQHHGVGFELMADGFIVTGKNMISLNFDGLAVCGKNGKCDSIGFSDNLAEGIITILAGGAIACSSG